MTYDKQDIIIVAGVTLIKKSNFEYISVDNSITIQKFIDFSKKEIWKAWFIVENCQIIVRHDTLEKVINKLKKNIIKLLDEMPQDMFNWYNKTQKVAILK